MESQNLNLRKAVMSFIALVPLMWGIGCAKKSGGFDAETPATDTTTTTNNPPPVTTRDTDGPRGSAFSAGATAELNGTTMSTLTAYVATHPLNNPTDLKISVKLNEVAYNQWAGDIYISYLDNNQYYTAHFLNTGDTNPSSGTLYPSYNHAFFNNWYSEPTSGKPVFHGFFADSYGAVMLVIDNLDGDQGDGGGSATVSGSIWYKNYPSTQVQANPQGIPCWFITAGPYDCRTFLQAGWNGDGILSPTSALTPDKSKWWTSKSTHPYQEEDPRRGWRKLGTFTGLNKTKAFTYMSSEGS